MQNYMQNVMVKKQLHSDVNLLQLTGSSLRYFLLINSIYGLISLFKQNADEVELRKQKRKFFIQLRK